MHTCVERYDCFTCVVLFYSLQGKFIRIHFNNQGKIAGADIEYCKLNSTLYNYIPL